MKYTQLKEIFRNYHENSSYERAAVTETERPLDILVMAIKTIYIARV